jgi:hypothetical protein
MTLSPRHLNLTSQTLNHVVAVTLSHLRKLNGIIKKLGEIKAILSCRSSVSSRYYILPLILSGFALAGCTSLKKAMLIGGGSLGAGAIASIATSGTAPVLLAGAVGASATSVVADVMEYPKKGGVMPIAASCAPDNFWTLLGGIVEMGGIYLIAILIIPMVLGWLLPGPLERKKKR